MSSPLTWWCKSEPLKFLTQNQFKRKLFHVSHSQKFFWIFLSFCTLRLTHKSLNAFLRPRGKILSCFSITLIAFLVDIYEKHLKSRKINSPHFYCKDSLQSSQKGRETIIDPASAQTRGVKKLNWWWWKKRERKSPGSHSILPYVVNGMRKKKCNMQLICLPVSAL